MELNEIKTLLDEQGKAFDAFKTAHEEQLKELKAGKDDPILADRLGKIEKSLDAAVEAKAAIEAKIEAERKERESLELRLNRPSAQPGDEKKAAALSEFGHLAKAIASERRRPAPDLDLKAFEAYQTAQDRYIREGKDALSAEEVKTLSVGSDPDGGYYVTPDVGGRIVTKVYETSPIRQIASSMTISTDALEGIEDLGEAGAGYAGEHAQGSDTTTPQIGKWRIPVFWIDTEPKTTQQLLDDASVDVAGWLSAKVGDKFARFENNEFVNGSANIRGFASYATAADSGAGVTWGSIGTVKSGASADFASTNPADALFDLVGLVKEAYLANARFVTRRSVITKIRKMKVSAGEANYLWAPGISAGMPETILGYPITRAEDIPALGASSLSLWFGDFRAAYQIVDRQGIRVVRDALTSKPYVKFYTTKRVGGGVVNFEAIKAMTFIN